MAQLQRLVAEDLQGEDRTLFAAQLQGRNIEQVLSRLRRIAALVTGAQTVDGLTRDRALELDARVCRSIIGRLDAAGADLVPVRSLAAWAARSHYDSPLELFTANYDLLFETALDELRVPYFDGFVGTLRSRFYTELVEGQSPDETVPAFFVRLWKVHGSVNWTWQEHQRIVRLGVPVPAGEAAAIYPSDTKYDESRRVPFVVLQDRFRRALNQPETLVLVSGYSLSDDHLNEILFDAATRRQRSEFLVFCYSEIPPLLLERAQLLPNLQAITGREAILGGVRAEWKEPEDAAPGIWEDHQLALRDFRHLAAYLARSSSIDAEVMPLPLPSGNAVRAQ